MSNHLSFRGKFVHLHNNLAHPRNKKGQHQIITFVINYVPIPGLVCKNRSDPPLRENTPLSKKHAPFQILDFQHFWSHAWTQCKLKQIAVNHPICFSEPWFPQKNTYIHHTSMPTLHLFIPGYPATWFHRLSSRNIMIYIIAYHGKFPIFRKLANFLSPSNPICQNKRKQLAALGKWHSCRDVKKLTLVKGSKEMGCEQTSVILVRLFQGDHRRD